MTVSRPGTSQRASPGRARRRRYLFVLGIVVTVCLLATLAVAVINGKITGVALRDGPIEGPEGVTATLPLKADNTGAIWGMLVLVNHSGATIVLDSVSVSQNPQQLEQLTEPYVWDSTRVKALNAGSLDVYALPLPAEWNLPAKRPVKGFELKSIPRATEEQAQDPDYLPDEAEIIFEFAMPTRASTVADLVVQYHVGWRTYRKTFRNKLTLCPPNDKGPCGY
jgi:hypothetical protein